MPRKLTLLLSMMLGIALLEVPVNAAVDRHPVSFTPGAPGIGDPYLPTDGNGGYNVRHYELAVTYDPASDFLTGVAGIEARATQNLSRFNLDLKGLTVRAVTVDGARAQWRQEGTELIVTPRHGIRDGKRFLAEIRYGGTPQPNSDPVIGVSGFIHTDDGALVVGQPHVASSWFPVNDHPSDKASYDIAITAPSGLETVSNGQLTQRKSKDGWTTWTWHAPDPMASYLATATIGEFDMDFYRVRGISYIDAIDPDLFRPVAAPTTGEKLLISQQADSTYKRLTRTITVPAGGAQLSYRVTRDTEQDWDYTFVEARTAGQQNWTTLPDANGHTTSDSGFVCPYWLDIHPFLAHYQSETDDGGCAPEGASGTWSAATGQSAGPELWLIDLNPYAGQQVEISISYASDDVVQRNGVFIDDITTSTGEGNTSFEDDGDVLDGWVVADAPPGSPTNLNSWIVGGADQLPPSTGAIAKGSLARQPEIIDFLSSKFGRYPFRSAGGIVDDSDEIHFALENQTRPIYAKGFFTDSVSGDGVVVHELAHQWFGDSLTVASWSNIWLNEGFATYAEWLWSEREGLGTAEEIADFFYRVIPDEDPFWSVTIGDPGVENLFAAPVYVRGALTLHQLRRQIGDDAFFRLLRTWAGSRAGDTVTTPQFTALAERISGQDLDTLFTTWLFTPSKPQIPASEVATARTATSGGAFAAVGRVQTSVPRR